MDQIEDLARDLQGAATILFSAGFIAGLICGLTIAAATGWLLASGYTG